MIYIKLNADMSLSITVNEPIYRGDHLNQKIIYLIPKTVGEIDMAAATTYLSYIRADGTADIDLLVRLDEDYNADYYQYVIPVTSTLSRYAGELCTFLQIFSGPANSPTVAKSGECIMQVLASKDMDEYISDRNLRLIYSMQREMEDKIAQTETSLNEKITETSDTLTEQINAANDAITEGLARKADNVVFNEDDCSIQLMCGGEPIGDTIILRVRDDVTNVTGAEVNEDGELIITFGDGSTRNLGVVVGSDGAPGKDGAVYVPHVDQYKVLTFTLEDEPGEIPEPVDLEPDDEWSTIDDGSVKTAFIWDTI